MSSTKELLVHAGLELLARDGLALGAESIKYANVFRHLREKHGVHITRGSVHERIWASHEDYRRDVLARAIQVLPTPDLATPGGPAGLPDHAELLAIDPAERTARLAYFNVKAMISRAIESTALHQTQAVMAVASRLNDAPNQDEFHRSFMVRYEAIFQDTLTMYPNLLRSLGLQPRASLGLTIEESGQVYYSLVSSLVRGTHLNYNAGYREITQAVAFRSKPADGGEAWQLTAIGVHAFLNFLTETVTELSGSAAAVRPQQRGDSSARNVASVDIDPTQGRRTRSQLKELVLAAGVDVLIEQGLDLKPSSLRYSAVLAHLEREHGVVVHRSSIRRDLWPSPDDYQQDVFVRHLLTTDDVEDTPNTTGPPASQGSEPGSTPDEAIISKMLERSAARRSSLVYKQRLLIKASIDPQKASPERLPLEQAIAQSERERTDSLAAEIETVLTGLQATSGRNLPDPESLRATALIAGTVETGALFDELAGLFSPKSFRLRRPDNSGQTDDWSLGALAVKSVLEQMWA